jgi:hypothetical protein
MFGLLGSLFTFAFALLTRGKEDDFQTGVQSRPAWLFFSATLGILIVLALVVPQLLGSSWMWRLRKDGLRGSCHAHCFGLLAPHEPIKFDMEDLATKAEALFDQIDTDHNGRLSSDELKRAVKQAQKDALDAQQNREPEDSLRRTPNTAENETAGLPRSRSVPNGFHGKGLDRTNGSAHVHVDGTHSVPRLHAAAPPETTRGLSALGNKMGASVGLSALGNKMGASDSSLLVERSSSMSWGPPSPGTQRDQRENHQASTAVLETIVRQVEERTRKKQSLMEGATRKRLSQMNQRVADAPHQSAHDANSCDTRGVNRIRGIWRQPKPRRAITVTAEGDLDHSGIPQGKPFSPPKPTNCSDHASGSGHGASSLKRLLSTSRNRYEWELKKWEWEEAIAESLF